MNFRRSRKKTVITLVSLGLTGVFLVTAATVLNSISPEKMAIEAWEITVTMRSAGWIREARKDCLPSHGKIH